MTRQIAQSQITKYLQLHTCNTFIAAMIWRLQPMQLLLQTHRFKSIVTSQLPNFGSVAKSHAFPTKTALATFESHCLLVFFPFLFIQLITVQLHFSLQIYPAISHCWTCRHVCGLVYTILTHLQMAVCLSSHSPVPCKPPCQIQRTPLDCKPCTKNSCTLSRCCFFTSFGSCLMASSLSSSSSTTWSQQLNRMNRFLLRFGNWQLTCSKNLFTCRIMIRNLTEIPKQ